VAVPFEEINEYNGPSGYKVTNESLEIWKAVLGDISVERGTGICSAGEVGFFGLLPHVTKELLLFDHAYASMYHAIGKYHLIEEHGSKKAYKLLSSGDSAALTPIFAEGNKDLPTSKEKAVNDNSYYARYYTSDPYYTRTAAGDELKRCFAEITQQDVSEFRANRDKVKILHGDINDLVERGPFDLVYMSNALEYTGRNGRDHKLKDLVKPGGFVCHTFQGAGEAKKSSGFVKDFEVVAHYRNGRSYSRHIRDEQYWKTYGYSSRQIKAMVKEEEERRKHDYPKHCFGMEWNYVVCQAPE
jgi:hypothetical protein